MDFDHFPADRMRAVPLETVLTLRGARRDRYDRSKWHTEQGPLSVTGWKFMNWHQSRGGGGAIDLVMHLAGVDYGTALQMAGTVRLGLSSGRQPRHRAPFRRETGGGPQAWRLAAAAARSSSAGPRASVPHAPSRTVRLVVGGAVGIGPMVRGRPRQRGLCVGGRKGPATGGGGTARHRTASLARDGAGEQQGPGILLDRHPDFPGDCALRIRHRCDQLFPDPPATDLHLHFRRASQSFLAERSARPRPHHPLWLRRRPRRRRRSCPNDRPPPRRPPPTAVCPRLE
jgi:hypothetical protein